ncbi:MAG: glycosyltransferase family 2 protein [Paracoccaceae bacterium]
MAQATDETQPRGTPGGAARRLLVVSPCRNEAAFARRTLDSVVAQTRRPDRWILVDDGSTDGTAELLADYAARHDWIEVIRKPDRGHRAVGPGVVEAFYAGLDRVDPGTFEHVAKLDLDLDLPPRYFEVLLARLAAEPRLGTCSGKPYWRPGGPDSGQPLVSERRGDEMSVGMTKIWRTACFRDIGGIVQAVMWDAIDCHKARMLGWTARSWDEPELRFEHLRPMGSSQTGILTGRRRHGEGQWYMGSDPLFYAATCAFRMAEPPYVIGGLWMLWGYARGWLTGRPRHDDPDLVAFVRAYQRRALFRGKTRAVAEIEAERAALFAERHGAAPASPEAVT